MNAEENDLIAEAIGDRAEDRAVTVSSEHPECFLLCLVVDNLLCFKAGKPPLTPVPETPFKGW